MNKDDTQVPTPGYTEVELPDKEYKAVIKKFHLAVTNTLETNEN